MTHRTVNRVIRGHQRSAGVNTTHPLTSGNLVEKPSDGAPHRHETHDSNPDHQGRSANAPHRESQPASNTNEPPASHTTTSAAGRTERPGERRRTTPPQQADPTAAGAATSGDRTDRRARQMTGAPSPVERNTRDTVGEPYKGSKQGCWHLTDPNGVSGPPSETPSGLTGAWRCRWSAPTAQVVAGKLGTVWSGLGDGQVPRRAWRRSPGVVPPHTPCASLWPASRHCSVTGHVSQTFRASRYGCVVVVSRVPAGG